DGEVVMSQQSGPPSVPPILPDMQAGWLTTGQLDKYVSFLALWPNSPVIVRVTGKLVGVQHRPHAAILTLTHFESGWDDETHIDVPPNTSVRILTEQPTEEQL